jgi:hypothetical protein
MTAVFAMAAFEESEYFCRERAYLGSILSSLQKLHLVIFFHIFISICSLKISKIAHYLRCA